MKSIDKKKLKICRTEVHELTKVAKIGNHKFNDRKLVLLFKASAIMGKMHGSLMWLNDALESFEFMTPDEFDQFESLASIIS